MEDTDESTKRFEVNGFALIGRTFEEYVHMFDLDPAALAGRTVLDCPSGVGSFVRTANDHGINAMGADIAYRMSTARLAHRARADYERVVAQLPEKASLFEWRFYGDIDGRSRYLSRAYEGFLDDFETNRHRYVHAACQRSHSTRIRFRSCSPRIFCFCTGIDWTGRFISRRSANSSV